jgi:hypothetical protein
MRKTLGGIALLLLATAPAAEAQVGHTPEQSPFRDLTTKQQLSLVTGYYAGSKGSAGVGPGGGPAVGMRYEVRIGGPAQFTVRVLHAFSERTVVNPFRSGDERVLGTRSWPVGIADVGITINLTGQKSYKNIVPVLHGGIGVATDYGRGGDPAGFGIGTPFAFSFGAGVRYISSGRLQLRVDFSDYLFTLSYPDSYFQEADDGGDPVLGSNRGKSEWRHNAAITVGGSLAFFR